MFEAPVFKTFYAVNHFQEKAFGDFPAFQAVFHTQIAALIMIARIERTARIRTRAKRYFTQCSSPLLYLNFLKK